MHRYFANHTVVDGTGANLHSSGETRTKNTELDQVFIRPIWALVLWHFYFFIQLFVRPIFLFSWPSEYGEVMHQHPSAPKESNGIKTENIAVVFKKKEPHYGQIPGEVFVKLGLWRLLHALVTLKFFPLFFIPWAAFKKISAFAIPFFIT